MAPIETTDLTKRYGDLVAVEDLTLDAHEGQVLGFLGPNGAGKSTTIKMLVGLVAPTEGSARIAGHDIEQAGVQARARLGYLPEVVGLYEQLTGEAYLRYVARFHDITGSPATHRIEQLLAEVRLTSAADRRIGTYSKGMRQRLALAGALLHDPEVLILDEPLTGLDPEGVVKMKNAIEALGEERTVFLSSHELHAVESLCERAVILREGRVLEDAPVSELTRRTPPRYRLQLATGSTPPTGLAQLDGVRDLQEDQDALLFSVDDADAASRALTWLVEQGCTVRAFQEDQRSLEEAFVDITGVRT